MSALIAKKYCRIDLECLPLRSSSAYRSESVIQINKSIDLEKFIVCEK